MIDFLALVFIILCSYVLGFLVGTMNELSNLMGLLEKYDYMTIPQFKREIQRVYG